MAYGLKASSCDPLTKYYDLVLYRVYTEQKSSSSLFCYFDDDRGLA